MASIILTGTLLDPNSDLAVGDQVRFTHNSTTGQTIRSSTSLMTVDPSGSYSVELQYGLILIEYKDIRLNQFKNLGVVTVNQDSTATSLPELLNAIVPPTDEQLLEFQAILADCVAAADSIQNLTKEAIPVFAGMTGYTFAQEFESIVLIMDGATLQETSGAFTVDLPSKTITFSESLVGNENIEAWFNYNTARGVQYYTINNVTSPYTLQTTDSGSTIVFDDAAAVVLSIPDGMFLGTASLAVNIGGGSLSINMAGIETIRGAVVIGDFDGQMSVQKIAPTVWQSSER